MDDFKVYEALPAHREVYAAYVDPNTDEVVLLGRIPENARLIRARGFEVEDSGHSPCCAPSRDEVTRYECPDLGRIIASQIEHRLSSGHGIDARIYYEYSEESGLYPIEFTFYGATEKGMLETESALFSAIDHSAKLIGNETGPINTYWAAAGGALAASFSMHRGSEVNRDVFVRRTIKQGADFSMRLSDGSTLLDEGGDLTYVLPSGEIARYKSQVPAFVRDIVDVPTRKGRFDRYMDSLLDDEDKEPEMVSVEKNHYPYPMVMEVKKEHLKVLEQYGFKVES